MENVSSSIAKYNALILEAEDFIEHDMKNGIIKVSKDIFDCFVKDTVVYIYCADINADFIMECVMVSEDEDGIVMDWLYCFSV